MGLLDQIDQAFGSGFDDPKSAAIMAFSGGLLSGNYGNALLGANDAYAQHKANALKTQLLQAQIGETQAQAKEREANLLMKQKRATALDNWMSQLDGAPSAANQAVIGQTGNLAPTMANAALQSQAFGRQTAGNPLADVDPRAARADMMLNEGKNIPEWLFKRTSPDMQNINGVWVDKTRAQAGSSIPQMSPTGQGYQIVPNPNAPGGYEIIEPQGASALYSKFKGIDAGISSQNELVKLDLPGGPRMVTKAQALQLTSQQPAPSVAPAAPAANPFQPRQPAAQSGPAPTGNFTGDPAQIMEAITQMRDPQERANAMAAFQEQAKRTRGFTGGASFGGGIQLQSEPDAVAAKTTAEQTAKDVAEQRKNIMAGGFSAPTNIAKYQQIGKLLEGVDGGKFTPAGYEVASALNSLGIKINPKLGNVQAAQAMANEAALQLRSPAGGAGMPGAMSDQDRQFLASMTPNIAQSAEGRKQVISSYVAVQQRNQQVATFARNYEKKYGRLDNGFFEQLQSWSNTNPLFGGK